jgi:hypothetical protein
MTILAAGAAQSATAELASNHTAPAAVGLVILVGAFALHHTLAHHHKWLDLAAKLLIIAGATILLASNPAGLLNKVNNWTASLLAGLAKFLGLGAWPHWAGALTMVELMLVTWCAAHLYALATGKHPKQGHLMTKVWMRIEPYFHKYGLILVGPLTVTLPGAIGVAFAYPFAELAAFIGHSVSAWT